MDAKKKTLKGPSNGNRNSHLKTQGVVSVSKSIKQPASREEGIYQLTSESEGSSILDET